MRTLFTLATTLWATYEFLLWDNGDLEIEDPNRNFEEDPESSTLPHIRLSKDGLRALWKFLNRPEIQAFIRQ